MARTGSDKASRAENASVALIALAAVGVLALRAIFGVSLYDDSHYVAVSVRLATGARPLADEMTVQSLGFLVPAAFTWVWLKFMGLGGLVVAFRLFYVACAAVVGAGIYRALRDIVRPAVAILGATLPLLCPPFNLVAPGYNTLAELSLLLATALALHALEVRARWAAVACGVALAASVTFYPPLAVAGVVLVVTFALLARSRQTWWLLAGGAVTLLVFAGGVLAFVTPAQIARGFAYASANVSGFGTPLHKLQLSLGRVWESARVAWAWPLWALALVACVPGLPRRLRAWLLLALPLAAALPGIAVLATGVRAFGHTAPAWLITFTIAAALPVALWAAAAGKPHLLRLLVLAAPAALAGFLTVIYTTDSGWMRAVSVIGLAPLALAVAVTWASALDDLGGTRVLWTGVATALLCASAMLWATSIDDGWPVHMTATVASGAYAGMHVPPSRAKELAELAAAGKRWVKPGDRVTFFGERNGYLLVGGQIHTNAVWLYVSPSDQAALDYFASHGGAPDVVFTDQFAMRLHNEGDYTAAARIDPFVHTLVRDYRLVERVDDFGVWVRR